MTAAALGLAHCLLGLGVLMLLFLVLMAVRRCLQRNTKPVPLPTPPICRRKLSVHTVYPPTPPITRQQMSIYTICRPTPPDSPLLSLTSGGKLTSPTSALPQSFFGQCQEPSYTSLQLTPPLQPHGRAQPTCSLPDRAQNQPLCTTWSLPGRPYQLLEP